VLWSLRTTPNHSVGFTPFFLVYGAEAVLPTDIEFDAPRVVQYMEKQVKCRGYDLWGMPRAELSAGWHPRSLHGSRMRRPAPPEGPAVPACGWQLHRGEPEPGDEDKSPPTAVSPKVAWPQQD
jgi:hypothetical protein